MDLKDATHEQLETAIKDILDAMYGCQDCERLTQDDTSCCAHSAADGIAMIDDALRRQGLVPSPESHASSECS